MKQIIAYLTQERDLSETYAARFRRELLEAGMPEERIYFDEGPNGEAIPRPEAPRIGEFVVLASWEPLASPQAGTGDPCDIRDNSEPALVP